VAFCDTVYASLYGCTLGFSQTNPLVTDTEQDAHWDPRGDVPNGLLRSDSYWQLDAGLEKTFRLPWYHSTLQLRGQFYNILNKTNFTVPGMTCCSTSFGRITSAYGPGRQGQLQAMVRF
jgi:outer membrane receptor protein involved in Fe transport